MADITAFQRGWWKQFLRSLEIGETVTEPLDIKKLGSLRVTITNIREERLFFETDYKDGKVCVKRLESKEKRPRRRKV